MLDDKNPDRREMFERFQSWALQNYGDSGKTKTGLDKTINNIMTTCCRNNWFKMGFPKTFTDRWCRGKLEMSFLTLCERDFLAVCLSLSTLQCTTMPYPKGHMPKATYQRPRNQGKGQSTQLPLGTRARLSLQYTVKHRNNERYESGTQ